jgi:dTDP-4-amino-4,6-dideoxygalactose transaminase
MSVESVEAQITPQTKAIIIVDIFGQTYDMEQINALAQKHGLYVIEDCAQAPDGLYKGQKSGTLGDIGIYSLNYHKHIHSGEGGMIVTDNDELADKLKLIRNHAESVLDGRGEDYSTAQLVNMIGYNYRMTEIEAAITRQQLKKLPSLVNQRIKNVEYLSEKLNQIPCIEAAKVRPDTKHCFYIHVLKYDSSEAGGIHRNVFVDAVKAELAPIELRETEGVKVVSGYVKPIYLQPLFQNKIAYGASHFPWSYEGYKGNVDYSKGICPVTERMHFKELINHELMRPGMTKKDLNDVANTFIKVYENRNELR